MLRVGIDVGGTFTDLAAIDSGDGAIVTLKVPSTPLEPQRAVLDALAMLFERCGCDAGAVEFLGHSTTIATNALLGQLGLEIPRVGLVTTQGFRDVIEIGRQNRSEVYNLFVERPRPLVKREDRFTVRERIDYHGETLEPLDEASLAQVCAELQTRENVAAVAICLLHSYANDSHERRVGEAVAKALPDAVVVCSSQVDAQYREYERFSTTVVNAALAPIVSRYLDRLSQTLRARDLRKPVYVMRSDGGLTAARYAAATPAAILESGPASGVIAAAALSRRLGVGRLLSFDMGGTTAKAGAIVDGVAQVVAEFEAAGKTHSGRAVKGSGYPVRFAFVDLAEVSAGGGTMAWIDDAGSLRVGPMSAGADPGPACYGVSDCATVTDANVVLGRLNPAHLLGGAFPIDAARARAAIAALGARLGLSVEETAAGVVTLIDAQMSKALRIVTIERGHDPRDFTLAAFGGSGPLHACSLADELGIARVLIPERPGIFSAYGLLDAGLRENFVRPLLQPLETVDFEAVERDFRAWEARGRETLLDQGAVPETIEFRREFDARYFGQSYELTISGATCESVAEQFHRAHRARYGYDARGESIELV
ncbi:MAG: hydantoinase/oxoprolinase family protein, partial [Candidatus Tumulicola sp.]